MTLSSTGWHALQDALAGEVVLPESPRYTSTRKPAMARFHDARPQAVVLCKTAEDVSEAISFARRHGLRTVPRSGGHCFAGRSSVEGIVIDVSPMRSYNRVPAGATAFAHRDERFLLLQVAVVEPDAPAAEREAARDWLARSWSSVRP